jgi:hypothetical protein
MVSNRLPSHERNTACSGGLPMNPILSLLALVKETDDGKVRLEKQPTKEDYFKSFECWIQRHFTILCFIMIVFLLVFFIWLCFTIVGVSAVESGGMRNFINGGQI